MSDINNLNTGGRPPKIVDEKVLLSKTNNMVLDALELMNETMLDAEQKLSTRTMMAKMIIEFHLKTRKQEMDLKLNVKKLQLAELDIRSKNGESNKNNKKPSGILNLDFEG